MQTTLSINLIASNPEVRGGRPVVAGTGVTVADIVMVMLFHRQSPDDIAAWFDLSLAQVHAALAYYYEHKTELDQEIKQRREQAAELKEQRVGSRRSLLSG
ncbi:MAG: DUF433 domain-containing protein [Chloroflexi bacterium]|nr:DUF433 domain-containing protein [Chloroflexota bacterium]